jgi:hypothetical protein
MKSKGRLNSASFNHHDALNNSGRCAGTDGMQTLNVPSRQVESFCRFFTNKPGKMISNHANTPDRKMEKFCRFFTNKPIGKMIFNHASSQRNLNEILKPNLVISKFDKIFNRTQSCVNTSEITQQNKEIDNDLFTSKKKK